jgi:hypothetical protein
MTLSDISTELPFKLRERFLTGRTRFSALAEGQDHSKAVAWLQETMIEAVDRTCAR